MKESTPQEYWEKALNVLIQMENAQKKLGAYLENFEQGGAYAICRAYVLNVVKHRRLLEYFLKKHSKKTPPKELKCFLLLVVGQMWRKFLDNNLTESNAPQLVNGWIERSKNLFVAQQCKFVNAILRKALPFFLTTETLPWNIRYNIPSFLLERYRRFYGEENLKKYLQWNESCSKVYIRTNEKIDGALPTPWEGFFELTDKVCWTNILKILNSGKGYIQDPMTRIPVEQLSVQEGNYILDLCAAPGGKSVQLVQKLKNTGSVVSVDLPTHMKRLRMNTQFFSNIHLIGKDILLLQKEDFFTNKLPDAFDRVLIDVPCSNTGVVRRKPDVLNRLTEEDFKKLPKMQFEMLSKASLFVKKGGLLVYSTCSIDLEENNGVVDSFLKQHNDFLLQSSHISLPWIDGHDGGGSFCFKKV